MSLHSAGGVPVVVSHQKCAGPRNWGRTVETLAHIDTARAHQPIALDMYLYIAGSTVLRKQMVDGIAFGECSCIQNLCLSPWP
jgi:N-acyl-D-amino-acid deacylase